MKEFLIHAGQTLLIVTISCIVITIIVEFIKERFRNRRLDNVQKYWDFQIFRENKAAVIKADTKCENLIICEKEAAKIVEKISANIEVQENAIVYLDTGNVIGRGGSVVVGAEDGHMFNPMKHLGYKVRLSGDIDWLYIRSNFPVSFEEGCRVKHTTVYL